MIFVCKFRTIENFELDYLGFALTFLLHSGDVMIPQ